MIIEHNYFYKYLLTLNSKLIAESNTKYNFIIGQCALAEIMCHGFERKLLVNTGWPTYKVQSV